MRWILLTLLLATCIFCGLRKTVAATDNNSEAFWHFVPGVQSRSLSDLEPRFRDKIVRIISELERDGYQVKVVATWRSPLRQKMVYFYSQLRAWVGLGRATKLHRQLSCHSQRGEKDHPAALAIDLALKNTASLREHARFFHRLGTLAQGYDLRWGGLWKRTNSTWRAYGLGWDPGHLESLRCL